MHRTSLTEHQLTETYYPKSRRNINVNSIIRISLTASLFSLVLTATTALHAQTIPQIAVLDLPDAPLPQAPTQQPTLQPAQSSSQPAKDDNQTEQEKKKQQQDEADEELKVEQHQRIGGVIPNFNAVLDGSRVPLTPKQKIRASFRSAIDPYQFALAGLTAGYGQATDSHSSVDSNGVRHGYEQGFSGYMKRFGANFTDQFDGTILGNGVFPAVLHQDPRYFRLGTGKVSHRFIYALAATVRCKGDNGKWEPNYSNLLGNLASGGISNLYYPASERGLGFTFKQGLLVTAEGALGGLLVEFYPDVQKHVFHKKDATPEAAPTK
jgi:hypothetical protein